MSTPTEPHVAPEQPAAEHGGSGPPNFLKRLSAVPDKEEAKEMHFDVIKGREELFEGIEKAAAAAKKLVRKSLDRISGHRASGEQQPPSN